jgi:protein TonB
VKVVSDPGHGFGRAARMCALGRRYTPGNDRAGQPITGTTPPIKVRFTR